MVTVYLVVMGWSIIVSLYCCNGAETNGNSLSCCNGAEPNGNILSCCNGSLMITVYLFVMGRA